MKGSPCEGCGVCCYSFSFPPFDANEVVKAPDELMQEIEDYASSGDHRDSKPCFWLDEDSKKCRHHEVRPTLCRWFEPGCKACNHLRVKAGLEPLDETT